MEDKEFIFITEKNKHLQDWRYVNMYPYNERWALQEEIGKFAKEIQKDKSVP